MNFARGSLVWTTIGIVLATGVSCGVAYLQWHTLEKTDRTLRAGERAFVYLEAVPISQVGDSWYFMPVAANNGTTQTVEFTYIASCNISIGVTIHIPLRSIG